MGLDPTFDLALCLRSGQVFRWSRGPDGVWMGVDGDRWFGLHDPLRPEEADLPEVRSLLGLQADPWTELLRRGPELRPLVDRYPGLRLMRPESVVETFFTFLCSANNSLHRIVPMCFRLGEFGEPFSDRPDLWRFPSVERLAEVKEDELRSLGFGYRGRTIPMAARAVMDRGGRPWLEGLREVGFSEARRALQEIHGVGPKLADCICLYGLHYTESTPIDTHLWQALVRHYRDDWHGQSLTSRRYEDAGAMLRDRFGDLAGLAQLVLYHDDLRGPST